MAVGAAARRQAGVTLDAAGVPYRELNERVHRAAAEGAAEIELLGVNGQRYIAAGLQRTVRIRIHGTAGNDLGVFMDGPDVEVLGNVQDGCGNTMNGGRIVVHGNAGQICGLSMRGGRIYVRGSVGYRSGIHMKGYGQQIPVIVVGGLAGAFLGEYMAGGRIYVLGLAEPPACPLETADGLPWRVPGRCLSLVGMYTGTGMHGGAIYVRGPVDKGLLGKEVVVAPADEEDREVMETDLADFASCFGLDAAAILAADFTVLRPRSHRPYGKNYAY